MTDFRCHSTYLSVFEAQHQDPDSCGFDGSQQWWLAVSESKIAYRGQGSDILDPTLFIKPVCFNSNNPLTLITWYILNESKSWMYRD